MVKKIFSATMSIIRMIATLRNAKGQSLNHKLLFCVEAIYKTLAETSEIKRHY